MLLVLVPPLEGIFGAAAPVSHGLETVPSQGLACQILLDSQEQVRLPLGTWKPMSLLLSKNARPDCLLLVA